MEKNISEKNHIEDLTIELRKELKWIRQLLVVIVFILIVIHLCSKKNIDVTTNTFNREFMN